MDVGFWQIMYSYFVLCVITKYLSNLFSCIPILDVYNFIYSLEFIV